MAATRMLLALVLCAVARAEGDAEPAKPVYAAPQPSESALFFESFDSQANFDKVWVQAEDKEYTGQWGISAQEGGEFAEDMALEMKNDAMKHGIAAQIPSPVKAEEGADLVIQYEVRLDKSHTCGGMYLKLLNGGTAPGKLDGDTPYTIMFGPDHCGGTNKVHFILKHASPLNASAIEEKHAKETPSPVTDKKTHLYTIVVRADNSFEFFVDQVSKQKGNLLEDMQPPVNPAKMIDDPTDKKPADWVDEAKINDPEKSKPADWDEDAPKKIPDAAASMPAAWMEDEPLEVADPDAKMPDGWDEDDDGEWEAPIVKNPKCEAAGCGKWQRPEIKNPAYKGKWVHPQIDNPDYIGVWSPKQIENPDFYEDSKPYMHSTFDTVGIELWTMTGGVFFDNILITRDAEDASKFADSSWGVKNKFELAKDAAKNKPNPIVKFATDAVDKAAKVVTDLGVPAAQSKNAIYVAFAIILATTLFLCCRGGGDDDEFDDISEADFRADKPTAGTKKADATAEKKAAAKTEEKAAEVPVEDAGDGTVVETKKKKGKKGKKV